MDTNRIKSKVQNWYYLFPVEAMIWIAGLSALALYDPNVDQHFSVCILDKLGFRYCPGCGLGHSVSYLLHGQFVKSFEAHPLGFIALILLSFRIGKLIIVFIKDLKNQKLNLNG